MTDFLGNTNWTFGNHNLALFYSFNFYVLPNISLAFNSKSYFGKQVRLDLCRIPCSF